MSVLYVTQELFCIFQDRLVHVHCIGVHVNRHAISFIQLDYCIHSKNLLTSIAVSISRRQEYICMNNDGAQQNLSQNRKKT